MFEAVRRLYISEIRDLYDRGLVVLTQHFIDNIGKRGITLADVGSAISGGEIIEQYPDDFPHPSALLLGNPDKNPLHVVVGIGGLFLWLITSYHPDPEKWEADNKTRKVAN